MAWKRKWKGNAFFLSKIHSKFPHGNWWAIAIRNRIANAHLPKTQFKIAHANAPWGWPFPWPGVYLKRSSKTRTRMHHGVGHFLTCRLLKTQFENAHANAPWRWQFPWPVVYLKRSSKTHTQMHLDVGNFLDLSFTGSHFDFNRRILTFQWCVC